LAIKLHRCPNEWVKFGGHPSWKAQRALDDRGIEYEMIKGPLRRGQRDDLERLSASGSSPSSSSTTARFTARSRAAMAARIKEGKLFEGRETAA
jgi:hypothetical protein